MASNKPVFTVKYGAVQLSIFENDLGEKGTVRSVVINKSYKAGDDWKTTSNFKGQDLPLIEGCIKDAMEFLYKKEQNPF